MEQDWQNQCDAGLSAACMALRSTTMTDVWIAIFIVLALQAIGFVAYLKYEDYRDRH